MTQPAENSLTIVIPALNEEEAIGSTVARCLEAREMICEAAGLDQVHITVVSDGSTDRTPEIAKGFDEVHVIIFEKNRGYGAAIKEGFRQSNSRLVSFLDADGTCDPKYFAEMCTQADRQQADVVLGSRLGPDSKMPKIRRLGNRIYALLLGILCGHAITDTASGMRVIKRDSLGDLYPLPDGLHFTPSMSARALLNNLRVIEIPMQYEERIGASKLSVLKDGVRFLHAIFNAFFCYRPERFFLTGFAACLLISLFLAAYPVEHYLKNRNVLDWMVYRFLACFLLGGSGFFMLCGAALSHRIAELGPRRRFAPGFWARLTMGIFQGKIVVALIGVSLVLAFAVVWPGLTELLSTGHVEMHWSRAIVGAFGVLLAVQTLVTAVLLKTVAIWLAQDRPAETAPPKDEHVDRT